MNNLLKCHKHMNNFLDYPYHQNNYKLFGIYLPRPLHTSTSQKISYAGKLEQYDSATMHFITEKQ